MITNLMVVVATLFCNNNGSSNKWSKPNPRVEISMVLPVTPIEVIGKTGIITFPQFKVEETFISESILHWTIRNEDGSVTEGDETISFKRLNDNQFFINWIEKTGLTVSQVIDTKNQSVISYISTKDDKSVRGGRSANFVEGKFEFKKS